jgi:transposase
MIPTDGVGQPRCTTPDVSARERAGRRLQCPACAHNSDRDGLAAHNLLVAFQHFVATGERPSYLCGDAAAMAKHAHTLTAI